MADLGVEEDRRRRIRGVEELSPDLGADTLNQELWALVLSEPGELNGQISEHTQFLRIEWDALDVHESIFRWNSPHQSFGVTGGQAVATFTSRPI